MTALRIILALAALVLSGCAFSASTLDGRHGVVVSREKGVEAQ